MNRGHYAVIAEQWSSSGRVVGNRIARGSSPSSAQRRWAAGPEAPPAAAAPATSLERARAKATLSRLMLEHNALVASGDTHETSVEIARHTLVPKLDAIVMTATGALRATIARPDLVTSAHADASVARVVAGQAESEAAGPLGKTVAAQMVRAADTALELAGQLGRLPGTTPLPGAPPPAARPPVHADPPADGDAIAVDEAPPPPRRGKGAAVAVAAIFSLLALLAKR